MRIVFHNRERDVAWLDRHDCFHFARDTGIVDKKIAFVSLVIRSSIRFSRC